MKQVTSEQEDCNHVVGWKYMQGAAMRERVTYMIRRSMIFETNDESQSLECRFSFCPDCGAKIDWDKIDMLSETLSEGDVE